MLVGLWQDKTRPSREVKRIALQQVAELESKIIELTAMRDALAGLAEACHWDSRPDCPILQDLEGLSIHSTHLPTAERPAPSRSRVGQRSQA